MKTWREDCPKAAGNREIGKRSSEARENKRYLQSRAIVMKMCKPVGIIQGGQLIDCIN